MTITTQAENMFAPGLAADLRSGRKNFLINGGMSVRQRGLSFTHTVGNAYTADRWNVDGVAGLSVDLVGLPLIEAAVVANQTLALQISATGVPFFRQRIENVENLGGKKAVLSFYAKASIASTIDNITIRQSFGTGGSPSALVDTPFSPAQINVGTSFTRHEVTVDIPSVSAKTLGTGGDDFLELFMSFPTGSTFTVTGFQLEEGEEATDFEFRPIGEELALCQRYFLELNLDGASSNPLAVGYVVSTTNARVLARFPVTMRVAPTLIVPSPTLFDLLHRGTSTVTTAMTLNASGDQSALVSVDVAGGLTAGDATVLRTGSTTALIQLDSEL